MWSKCCYSHKQYDWGFQAKHMKICRHGSMYSFAVDSGEGWETVQELVQHFRVNTLEKFFSELTGTLMHPLKRVSPSCPGYTPPP